MSTLTSPPRLFDLQLAPEREHEVRSDGGRLTLEQRLQGVWEGLSAAGAAPCPLCGGRMEHTGGGVGRCRGCGSTLA